MPEQPDFDFFDEIAVSIEQLRVRVARRLDAGHVDKERRPEARSLQHDLLLVHRKATALAAMRNQTVDSLSLRPPAQQEKSSHD